ncbi:hypothetical protein CFC21_012312 [Triticum aestivum]|uniref:F-box domain-containing protein n=2 Tax=Triticum aestivum TaxID=4565 RepID=A0A3B5ZXK9_WHEAT|nr:hypothetical protein CFC21_012312 [Triticum aestivum]
MASPEGRRRCRRRGKKSKAKKKKREAGPTTVQDLPDHLFELILVRLGPSPCLVRAAAACRRWCRVVGNPSFFARFGPVHAQAPHVGDYHAVHGGQPLFVPSSPAVVDRSRFSLEFLPESGSWDIADSRGSLLLLTKKRAPQSWRDYSRRVRHYPDLMVCEPLTGLYQGILWPEDLNGIGRLGVFLLDGDDADRRVSTSNFRVLAAVDDTVACVFSTGSEGGWRIIYSEITSHVELPKLGPENFVGRANGTLYWGIDGCATAVLALDETTAEFSIAALPETVWGPSHIRTSRIVGGEDGVLHVIRLIGNELKVFAQWHPGSDEDEWLLEMQLMLPEATLGLPGRKEHFFRQQAMIVAANTRYVLLTPSEKSWLFSVELDTMRIERKHERNRYAGEAYPCKLPWPPALVDHGRERR